MSKGDVKTKVKKYYLTAHYAACLAPVDSIMEFRFDDRKVATGPFGQGTVSIDKEELYGGLDREGGVKGPIRVMLGSKTQGVNSTIENRFPGSPAYRGVCSVLLDNFYIGMTYYLKAFSLVARRIHSTSSGLPAWMPSYIEPITGQMNGVHIIRDLLTDTLVGLGVPLTEIGTSWEQAAITCYNEGYGFTFLFAEGKSIDEYIKIVKSHINAEVYKSRTTNKYEIKLVRKDYTIGSIFELNSNNVKEITSLKRTLPGELFSKVVVQYINGATYKDAVEVAENFTLSNLQGGYVEKAIEFRGCRSRNLATKLAARELLEVSTQIYMGTVVCNREAENLNLGQEFVLKASANPYIDVDIVCRVAGINLGTATDNKVTITFAQDIFEAQEAVLVNSEESLFEDVTNAPVPASSRLVNETPYYIYAKNLGDAEAQAVTTTVSFLSVAANAPTDDSYEATIWVNGVAKGRLSFCAYGTLDIAMSRTSTTVTLANTNNLETLIEGQFIQVGLELMGIVSIVSNVLTVIRGVLDTVPINHIVGENCFAWQGLNGTNGVQYFLTENLSIKITPRTPQGELSFAAATADSLTIIGRMHLPYPPGNLKLNAVTFPSLISVTDIIVTWATRNRFTQTIGLTDYYSGSLTSEPGVTYAGELRRVDTNGLLLSFTGVAATTTTLTTMLILNLTSLTNVGTLATVVTTAPHGLVTDRKIEVTLAADGAFNGIFTITVLTTTSFTYTMSTTPTLASTGAVVKASLYVGDVKFSIWSVNANGNSFQKTEHTFAIE
jgi:hypothetical protein